MGFVKRSVTSITWADYQQKLAKHCAHGHSCGAGGKANAYPPQLVCVSTNAMVSGKTKFSRAGRKRISSGVHRAQHKANTQRLKYPLKHRRGHAGKKRRRRRWLSSALGDSHCNAEKIWAVASSSCHHAERCLLSQDRARLYCLITMIVAAGAVARRRNGPQAPAKRASACPTPPGPPLRLRQRRTGFQKRH